MKNIVISFFMVLVSVFGFGQTVSFDVDSWYSFESKLTNDYNVIVNDDEKVLTTYAWGKNTLTFDLSNKTYKFFLQGSVYATGEINYEFKDDVYIFTCKTIDMNTNEPMEIYVIINTIAKSNEFYVTEYYLDENTNKSYGMISYKN